LRIDGETYQRLLGDELRKLRKQRGWTRRTLAGHLKSGISLQTLATYELGTRQCSVVRLVEICLALDELPHDLIARVHERMFTDTPGRIRIDLRRIVNDTQPELHPLRRWATDRMRRHNQPHTADVYLDHAALEQLAQLCGVSLNDLRARLRVLSPAQADD
jgi:transcriptional regulator with XRE-family HTH domain